MAEIESPLGKTSSGPTRSGRVLTVEDESGMPENEGPGFSRSVTGYQRNAEFQNSQDDFKAFEGRRKEAMMAKKRVSPEAKERIMFLSELGRIVKSVTVEDIEFTFQSLKGSEQNEVYEALSSFKEISALRMQYEIRFHTLARALTHIQGKEFSAVIESDDIEDKLDVIRELDENVSDFIYKWYQKEVVNLGQEKYAVNTPEDAEEVVDAIKKS